MGLAALTGNIPALAGCLAQDSTLLHKPCGHPAMNIWLGEGAQFRSFSKTMTPFGIALLAVAPEAALWLMDQPGFRMLTDLSSEKAKGPLSLLMLGAEDEPDKGERVLPVFARLCKAGLSPLQNDGLGFCPLSHLVWAASNEKAMMPYVRGCLASLDLSTAKPVHADMTAELKRLFRHLQNGEAATTVLEGEEAALSRYPTLMQTLFDWLVDTGWTEPLLLDAIDEYCPEVRAAFDARCLDQKLPADASRQGKPSPRL
jgi:hypothetical protein